MPQRRVEHVHFLVHPAYPLTLHDRLNRMPRILGAYARKINAIARLPGAQLRVVLPFEDPRPGSPQRVWLDALLEHAEGKMPGRVKVFHDDVDDSELSRLKREISPDARLHFWGEYYGNCVHQQALKAAYALDVKPEEAAARLDFNRAHSVEQGTGPLYLDTFDNRAHHRRVYNGIKDNMAEIKRAFNNIYSDYYSLRKRGASHASLFSNLRWMEKHRI